VKFGGKDLKRKKYIIFAILFVCLTLATALGINFILYAQDDHLLHEGVMISGIDVGNLTKEEAQSKIQAAIDKWLAQSLEFQVNGEVITIPLAQLKPTVDLEAPLNEAYKLGRKASFFEKTQKVTSPADLQFELELSWDQEIIREVIENNLASFNKTPVDASFTINDANLMDIIPAEIGYTVPTEEIVAEVQEINLFQELTPIEVALQEINPSVTTADLEAQKIDGLIASYTTWFDPNNIERTANVRLAAEALDKALIAPGELISFNDIVGERTGEKGYQDALIVVNGQFVPGLGGGICQVSSTLYNAGLLANLKIEERMNHGLAVAYVPLGRDATVVYGSIDLKMRNTTEGYILLRSKIYHDSLTIEVYGKKVPGQEIIITNNVEQVIPFKTEIVHDSTLAPGKEIVKQTGQNGYVATATRIIKQNGQVVETQSLGRSTYIVANQVIHKGPDLPPQSKPEPSQPAPSQPTPSQPESQEPAETTPEPTTPATETQEESSEPDNNFTEPENA